MSNIQITENESGKYSPDWFYNEAQIPECISLAHKADELRENFINLFHNTLKFNENLQLRIYIFLQNLI